ASASPVSQALNWHAWMMLLSSAAVGTALILPLAAFSGYCVGTFNVARLVPLMVLQKSSLVLLCTGAALVFESARSVSLAHLLSGALTMAALVTLVRREIRGDLQDARRLARERSGLIIQLALPAAIS